MVALSSLTARQKFILKTIITYWQVNLSSPSFRDVCQLIDVASPNGLECHLRALEKKGYIERHRKRREGKARTRSITIPGMTVAFPEWINDL